MSSRTQIHNESHAADALLATLTIKHAFFRHIDEIANDYKRNAASFEDVIQHVKSIVDRLVDEKIERK